VQIEGIRTIVPQIEEGKPTEKVLGSFTEALRSMLREVERADAERFGIETTLACRRTR
jgi:hypothetical protein